MASAAAWSLFGSIYVLEKGFFGPLTAVGGKAVYQAWGSCPSSGSWLRWFRWASSRLAVWWAATVGGLDRGVRELLRGCRRAFSLRSEQRERQGLTAEAHLGRQARRRSVMWVDCVGNFVVVSRNGEWDEMFLVQCLPAPEHWLICLTTPVEGDQWRWVVVRPVEDLVKVMGANTTRRREPEGVERGSINWMCEVPDGAAKWAPSGEEIRHLTRGSAVLMPDAAAFDGEGMAVPGAEVGDFRPSGTRCCLGQLWGMRGPQAWRLGHHGCRWRRQLPARAAGRWTGSGSPGP